jgi:hypothetical protein
VSYQRRLYDDIEGERMAQSQKPSALLTPQRRQQIENRARIAFEGYRHLVEDLCGEEIGPRAVLPVQTGLIISKLYKIHLRAERNLSIDRDVAMAGWSDGKGVVISEDQSLRAKRFTEAHEIGHLNLHPGEAHPRARSASIRLVRPAEEREADCFASNLLMPAEIVIDEFNERFGTQLSVEMIDDDMAHALTGGRISPSQIRRFTTSQFAELLAKVTWYDHRHFDSLKDVFGVSGQAMAWRLSELRLVLGKR